jgi:hypothetical protein
VHHSGYEQHDDTNNRGDSAYASHVRVRRHRLYAA